MNSILIFILALKTIQIELGGHQLTVEVASQPHERNEGLKNRRHLPENHGMLFVFEEPEILSFWMKDTFIPLSIGYFDQERILIEILDMSPQTKKNQPLPLYQSRAPALYALEMPLHWYQEKQIRPGMKFSFQEASD